MLLSHDLPRMLAGTAFSRSTGTARAKAETSGASIMTHFDQFRKCHSLAMNGFLD
jgi:hypothetical protein